MPLPSLILDDRSYQQLRDELVRRIPVYAPEWTDHNASDPGITLIELFSFLGENLLFRFNQIPEAAKLEFLKLLHIPMRPATASTSIVTLTTKVPEGQLVEQGTVARAGKFVFELEDEVHAWPLGTRTMAKLAAAPPDPQDKEAWDYLVRAQDARGIASNEEAVYYTTTTVPSDPAAPGAEPVDFGNAVDGMVWVAVTGPPDTMPRPGGPADLIAKLAGKSLGLGLILDQSIRDMNDVDACPGSIDAGAPAPGMRWEISLTGSAADGPKYRALALLGDSTRGLTQDGVVQLDLPHTMDDIGLFTPDDPDLAGTGDLPPDPGDKDISQNLLFWLRAFRPREEAPFGRIWWMGINASRVVQSRKAPPEFLGTGTADADQRYALVNTPVIEGSLALDVEEGARWTRWSVVDGFEASTESDRHCVLDLESGEVRFGNGVRGRTPQIGERIRAVEYRYGGGPDGNVGAGAINKLESSASVKLAGNPLPARGGAPAETIKDALDRVPGELRRRDRAVTPGDFRELALATPGALVGRAESLPLFAPSAPTVQAAGVVSVVIWPREDSKHPNAPMPDRTLLREVCCWLDRRRLLTTELYVIPPTYRKVAVAVGLQVKAGFGVEAVRRWVELVIRQYLAPLPPYGPDGGGWHLGHRVYGPELEAAALQVEGTDYLEGLTVAGLSEDGSTWVPGPVLLLPHEVPELAEITVVEGQPLEPGAPLVPSGPTKTPVPIPVLEEEC